MKAKWERLNMREGRASANPVEAATPEDAAWEFGVTRPGRRRAVMEKGRPHFPPRPVEVVILRRVGSGRWRVFIFYDTGYVEGSKW